MEALLTDIRITELEEAIKSFPSSLDIVKSELLTKLTLLRVGIAMEYNPRWRSISWSIADFEGRAKYYQIKFPEYNYVFDDTKFVDALEKVINDHDANIGITWYTIDYYLMQFCLISSIKKS